MPERSLAAIVDVIDWQGLPPDVQDSLRLFGHLLCDGFRYSEVAQLAGLSESVLKQRVAAIRAALLEQALASGELDESLRERLLELAPQ